MCFFSLVVSFCEDRIDDRSSDKLTVLDTPNNFDESSKDRYHAQIIVSWADSKGIPVPKDNAERIALMKKLTDNWAEPFRSLVEKLPEDAEARSIRIEDWMFTPSHPHDHPRAVLMGDSAHTMTMCKFGKITKLFSRAKVALTSGYSPW
jgi:hypothetical protein